MTKVLVTGAAGNVGAHVVRELRERGASVRAFVRDPGRAMDRLGDDVELAVGDFEDAVSLRRAMHGVDRVFLTCADGPGHVAQENAVIDAAAAAWVQRIVKLSVAGAGIGSPVMFSDAHGRIERHLRESNVPSVVLQSTFFMSNLFASADTIHQAGQIFAPADDAKIAMIDPRDVAAAAAAILLADRQGGRDLADGQDGPDGRTYVITGPQAITYSDVAAELTTATGRRITFVDVPDEAARSAILQSGAPDWFADSLVLLYGMLRDGAAAHTTDSVYKLTGRQPRTFAEFAHDHRAMFAG